MQQISRPTRQQSRSQRTRSRIVDTAFEVFAAKGYPETSMEDVCLAAGCSKGGLYHHFRTKIAILAEVAERLRVLDGLAPPLGTFSVATGIPELLLGRLLLDLWAEAARDPALAARLRAGRSGDVLAMGRLVQETVFAAPAEEASRAA